MKLGIVITSNHPETVWNAFRLGNFSLNQNDKTQIFLMANGVEAENLSTDQFNVGEQMELFLANGGILFACGTCIKIRKKNSSELCPMSNMADLYGIINQSDKVISF
tara:strand:- start:27 stop:347 length:321 start_codon:yes stop_codon:yes gene_type:complete